MATKPKLTHKYLKSILKYDPLTGVFTWVVDRVGGKGAIRRKAGTRAGSLSVQKKYRKICIDYQHYYEHVLAIFWMTGKWPKNTIDHRNLDGTDNRWKNLREATQSQNNANQNLKANNTSGYRGVYLTKTKNWQAKMMFNGKRITIGTFPTPEAAAEAYRLKAQELHGEFANVG